MSSTTDRAQGAATGHVRGDGGGSAAGPGRAALSGVLAVGLALGISELLAALLQGVPSLVLAVGSALIPFVPPAVEDWAIQTFGTSDKVVLNAGTTLLTLAVGAWAGAQGARAWSGAVALFTVFGLLGWLTAVMQPLSAPALTLLTTALATGAGLLALHRLLAAVATAASPTSPGGPGPDDPVAQVRHEAGAALGRRRFLGLALGVGAAAAVSAASGRMLLSARRAPLTTEDIALPDPAIAAPPPGSSHLFAEVDGLTPIVVPNGDFYRIDTVLTVPRIEPADWSLRVHGMVQRELTFSYQDLLARPLEESYVTLSCVSNEIGGGLVGTARWLGVRLADVLEEAGVRPGAGQIVGRAIDGFTVGFPTEVALDGRDALIAVGMNGESLPAEHGYPARLVVPGLYGYVSATKWLTEIELTTWQGFDAYWVPRGWSKRGPVKTMSRIDVPRPGSSVDAGELVAAGVAWGPHRGISRVEVRVDDRDWVPAELTTPLSESAWVQWRATVLLEAPGEHHLQVRAYDADGGRQPPGPVPPRPDGAEGWHGVRVAV